MNYPAVMEERGSEYDLMCERFGRLLDYGWFLVGHVFKMRSNDLRHQYVVLSVHALYLEMVQESEDVIRSWMGACPGRKVTMDLEFIVPARKLSHDELEGDVSATLGRDS